MPDDKLISTADAAAILGVTVARVRVLIRQKRLPAQTVSGRHVLRPVDVAEFAKLDRPQGWPKDRKRGPKKPPEESTES